jgi:signal transduction histidine kinase
VRDASPRLRIGSTLIGALTAGAAAITAGVTASGAHATTGVSGGAAVLQALARGIVVGVPLAVALYACQRPAHARFGRALLVASGLWFLASLSNSASPLFYSIGRIAGWLAETALVYTVLAFPDGRLRARIDQALMAASAVVVTTLYLPTALFVARYPTPSPWSSCRAACPHNVFMTLGSQPAFIGGFVDPFRELLTAVVFVIVAARLATRIRDANSLMRRTLTPVLVVAIARLLAYVAMFVARRVAPGSPFAQAGAWLVAFGLPALAVAFIVGLGRWHLFVTTGIRTVNARLREMPGPEQVRELLAAAFDDPGLQIASWSGRRHRWIAADGEPLDEPGADSGQSLSEVRDGRRRAVAILHDAALADNSAFVETAATAASVGFASDRVAARTSGLVRELRASRARILAAADGERRRIERDLHDGAQQRLVALCIHLELAAEKAESEHPAEAASLRELIGEVEQALEEIRSLTRGIYPALLLDRGLAEAVQSAARHSTVPTTVEVEGLGEYPDEISTAVYFCCAEALQNVAKHAPEASSVRIVLREAGSELCFSVADDGPGLIDSNARVGAGMLNMRDRITSVGGQLTVHAHPGEGTRVSGRIPLAALAGTATPPRDGHAPRRTRAPRRRDRTGT